MTGIAGTKVVTGVLHRVRRGRRKGFAPEPPSGPIPRPARVPVMLALAHQIQRAIDQGEIRDRAEVARRQGMTSARVTQLLGLTLLAPDLQERILSLESVAGAEQVAERTLRPVARARSWAGQRTLYKANRVKGPLPD